MPTQKWTVTFTKQEFMDMIGKALSNSGHLPKEAIGSLSLDIQENQQEFIISFTKREALKKG